MHPLIYVAAADLVVDLIKLKAGATLLQREGKI